MRLVARDFAGDEKVWNLSESNHARKEQELCERLRRDGDFGQRKRVDTINSWFDHSMYVHADVGGIR